MEFLTLGSGSSLACHVCVCLELRDYGWQLPCQPRTYKERVLQHGTYRLLPACIVCQCVRRGCWRGCWKALATATVGMHSVSQEGTQGRPCVPPLGAFKLERVEVYLVSVIIHFLVAYSLPLFDPLFLSFPGRCAVERAFRDCSWPSNEFRAYDRFLPHGDNDSMYPSSFFVYPNNSVHQWKYFRFAQYRPEACQGIYSLCHMVSSCCTLAFAGYTTSPFQN